MHPKQRLDSLSSRPHFLSITNGIRHQPRAKISSKIDRISSLIPKASPQSKDQKKQSKREKWSSPRLAHSSLIRVILKRENHKHKYGRINELRKELTRLRQERLRIRAEDPCRGGWRGRHCPDTVAFIVVNGVYVIDVHDARRAESAEELCEEVDGEALPGQFAEEAKTERNGRIEKTTAISSDIDSQTHSESPTPTNGLIRTKAITAWCSFVGGTEKDLRHGAVAKHHHDEGAPELGEWFPEGESDLAPCQIMVFEVFVLFRDGRQLLQTDQRPDG